MTLTRPDSSQIAYGDRTLGARLDDYVNVKNTGAAATDPATTQALVNSIRTILINLGVVS